MLNRVATLPAVELSSGDYLADFWPYFQAMEGTFWKLERGQTFREPEDPSWVALDEGDWERAIALIDDRAEDIQRPIEEAQHVPLG